MNENVIMPPPAKKPAKNRGAAIAWIVAIIAVAAGAFEFQHAKQLAVKLSDANAQVSSLQSQLQTMKTQIENNANEINELKKHNMPITLIFRRAPGGNGLVCIFKNNAPQVFDVAVLLNNPVNHHSREANLTIPANGQQSIGEMEGWIFEPGQHIRLTNVQYGSVDFVVPEQP
jgi:hypothetical protein